MKQAEAYLRAARRGLKDAPPADRERLMKRLTEAVSAYLDEEPEASEADVIEAFGTPEACAAELMEECDPAQVAAVRRKRRLRLYAAIAALALIAALVVLAALALGRNAGSPASPTMDSSYYPPSGHAGHGFGHHG